MLVLSRKKNEKIVIADNVVISVVEIRGDKVRIGIDAPKDINIVRSELVADIGRTELPKPIRDEMESILKRKGLVEDQPVNGSSQEGDRMDCEGDGAPFYSETSILNAMV